MPVLAVLLAIGFSAFTAPQPVKAKKTDTLMFWYFFDEANNKLDGQLGDVQKTHEQAQSATNCYDPPNATVECARGYGLEQNPYQEVPAIGDDVVKKID